jgi:hypothetical protein
MRGVADLLLRMQQHRVTPIPTSASKNTAPPTLAPTIAPVDTDFEAVDVDVPVAGMNRVAERTVG